MLRYMRRFQGLRQGRLLASVLVVVFLATSSFSQVCALAASGGTATSTGSHCGECPDRNSQDNCPSASFCVFAGTAAIKSDVAAVPHLAAAPERIELKLHRSASIFLVPPNPPPILT
jgi:hypothetical protein